MSEQGNTGVLPSNSLNSAQFEDVPAVNSANTSPDFEGNMATSEPLAFATAEPVPTPAPSTPAPSTLSKKGKPMSVKQVDLQRLRAETLADMREKYAERFAGYSKPPKAKAYHAAGLATIRQRDGEAAYIATLNKYMNANDPKKGTNGISSRAASLKAKKLARNNTVRVNPRMAKVMPRTVVNTTVNVAANNSAKKIITSSIDEMGRTAKGLIDSIVKASKSLSQEAAKNGRTATLKNLSKTVKSSMNTRRNVKPLAPLYENKSRSALNMNSNSNSNTNSNSNSSNSNKPLGANTNWSSTLNKAVLANNSTSGNTIPPPIGAEVPNSELD